MSLLDIIKNLFNNNKINTHVYCEDLHKVKGETTPLSVVLTDKNGNLLANKPVDIEINNVEYTRITDENGIARLNINLNVGSYPVGVSFNGDDEYNKSTGYCKVFVSPKLTVQDLNMKYSDGSKFTARVTDNDNNPLPDIKVVFKIHGVPYNRVTDNKGIASLNINLNPGNYTILTTAIGVTASNTVNIEKGSTRMEGTDINKTFSEKVPYQCAVYDVNNRRVPGVVNITVNGITYPRTPDAEGLYKLNINLNPGTYTIKAEFSEDSIHESCSIVNNVVVNNDQTPAPKSGCTNPYTSSPHPTSSGCNGMGQNTSTYCAPSSVHKCLYKFGIRDISQATLASWMATNSSGTSHQGIETGIAKVNQVKGTNIKIQWYNKSDLSWEEIGKILCQPNKAIFCHILYKNGGTCSGSGNYGHYELLTKVNTDTGYVKVLNSLGGYCGSCYCGFYQDRTMACQEQFMRGISQKSIAVLTKQ